MIFGLNSLNDFISLILMTDDRYNYYQLHFLARKRLKNENVDLLVANFVCHLRSSSLVLKSSLLYSICGHFFVYLRLQLLSFNRTKLTRACYLSVLHGQATPGSATCFFKLWHFRFRPCLMELESMFEERVRSLVGKGACYTIFMR